MINKNKNISKMFNECISLSYLSDLSKWNYSTFPIMNNLLDECISLLNLNDLFS